MTTPLLDARTISKFFGDFTANDAVNFSMKGTIHALLGENGAGKSTFVKMLYGVLSPDQGQFYWNGTPVRSPHKSRSCHGHCHGVSAFFIIPCPDGC